MANECSVRRDEDIDITLTFDSETAVGGKELIPKGQSSLLNSRYWLDVPFGFGSWIETFERERGSGFALSETSA